MCLEFLRDVEMAASGDVFLDQSWSRSIGDIVLDNGANSGGGFVRKRIELVFLHFNDSHDVVPLDGDVIGSAVLDDNLAVLIAVNGEE